MTSINKISPKNSTELEKKDFLDISKENLQRSTTSSNPIKLTFENLTFEVNTLLNKEDAKQSGKRVVRTQIVKGVSGYALPGQTLYIMGSSGAGKTSLMNLLSDRVSTKNGSTVSGSVKINDSIQLTQSLFGSLAAYVMQDDILFAEFTPREALTFAARLKLNKTIEEQNKRVEEIINELGLYQCADTVIGNVLMKTISGGERKRTAIGVELITDPSLLLLDEPTSGLDSFKALEIVKMLDRQAKKGKTIVSTLHQPSSEAFRIFDRLILMRDGHIVFQGKASDSTLYFSKIGFQCPIHSNPADFYMSILSQACPLQKSDSEKIMTKDFFAQQYDLHLRQTVQRDSESVVYPLPQTKNVSEHNSFYQFGQLMWRNRQQIKRNPMHSTVKISQNIFMGLLCLALFFKQEDYSEARSLIAGLFFIVINATMMNLMGTILIFQNERPVFLREQANKMYSVGSYYIAKIVAETPVLILAPMIYSLIVYFGIGLTYSASQFFYFYLILLLITQCSASFGYFMSSIFNNEETAVAMAPVIMMPIILFGGQFANSDNIQAWISWFQYISPIRYGFEAIVINEYDNRQYNSTMILKHMTTNYTVTILNAFSNNNTQAFNSSEWKVLQYPEQNPSIAAGFEVGMWKCLVILAALTIALRILSAIFLKLLVSKFQ